MSPVAVMLPPAEMAPVADIAPVTATLPDAVTPPWTVSAYFARMPMVVPLSVMASKSCDDAPPASQLATFSAVMVSRTWRLACVCGVSCSSAETRSFRSQPRAADRIQPVFVASYAGQASSTKSRRSYDVGASPSAAVP